MSSSYLDYFAKAIEKLTEADIIRVLKEDFATSDEIARLYIETSHRTPVDIRCKLRNNIAERIVLNKIKASSGINILNIDDIMESIDKYMDYIRIKEVVVYEVPSVASIVAKGEILQQYSIVKSLEDYYKEKMNEEKCIEYYQKNYEKYKEARLNNKYAIYFNTKAKRLEIYTEEMYMGMSLNTINGSYWHNFGCGTLGDCHFKIRIAKKNNYYMQVEKGITVVKLDGSKHEYWSLITEEEDYIEQLREDLSEKIKALYIKLKLKSRNNLLIFLNGLQNNKLIDTEKLTKKQKDTEIQAIAKKALYNYIIYYAKLHHRLDKLNVFAFKKNANIDDKLSIKTNYEHSSELFCEYKDFSTETVREVVQALERNNNWFKYVLFDENGGLGK